MTPMTNDVRTIVWKEWKEALMRGTHSRSDMLKTIVVAPIILGIVVWQASNFMSNPASLIVPSLVLIQMLTGLMADSFAGERERHTLETLLASRLPDVAILTGKILAGVLLAWGVMVITLSLGVAVAYARSSGELNVPFGTLAAFIIIYFLLCSVVSCAAALVSLRASTVRQAIQTLAWSFMAVVLLGVFGVSRLPAEWRGTLMRVLAGENLLRTEVLLAGILAIIVVVVFGAARLRFVRSRLILD